MRAVCSFFFSLAFKCAPETFAEMIERDGVIPAPYLARAEFHAVVPLGTATEDVARDPLSGLTTIPTRRVEVRVGKMSTADSFDLNSVGSDSHLQFLNWTIDNNGAFDYAADTRGYTLGALAEVHVPLWSVRAGLMLMPAVANGIKLDHDLRHARGENVEIELRPRFVADRVTTARVLLQHVCSDMDFLQQRNSHGALPVCERMRLRVGKLGR